MLFGSHADESYWKLGLRPELCYCFKVLGINILTATGKVLAEEDQAVICLLCSGIHM